MSLFLGECGGDSLHKCSTTLPCLPEEAIKERIISKAKENDLKGIRGLESHAGNGGRVEITLGFSTCLCGHFHTYPKAAEAILRDMKGLGLIEDKRGTVRVLVQP